MATKAFLEKAYLAYFGRPVDPTGLTDFAASTEAQVADAFAASAESKALYGSTFNYAQINAIYLALFNREAEKAGLEYWYAKVADKTYTAAGAAIAILNGAQNADKTAIENKLAASAAFSAALDTASEMIGYSGDAAAAAARSFLSSVTTTPATAAAVDAAVASTVAAKTAVAGQTFTLTSSSETKVGTANNDTFLALNNGDLGNGDIIDGGAGTDTLFAVINTGDGTAVSLGRPVISNVETVEIELVEAAAGTQAGDTNVLNLDKSSGIKTVAVKNYTFATTADTTAITGVTTATSLKITDDAGHATARANNFTVTYDGVSGTADSASVEISSTVAATVLNNITVAGVETLTVSSTGGAGAGYKVVAADATTLNLNASAKSGGAVDLAGAKIATLNINAADDVTVTDAGAASAKLRTVNIDSQTADKTVTLTTLTPTATAATADTFTVNVQGAGKASISVDTNWGTQDATTNADSFIVAAGANTGGVTVDLTAFTTNAPQNLTVTGGSGNDTVTVNGLDKYDSINLGAGSADTLAATMTFNSTNTIVDAFYADTTAAADVPTITGVEVARINLAGTAAAGTFSAKTAAFASTVEINAASAVDIGNNDFTVSNLKAGQAVKLGSNLDFDSGKIVLSVIDASTNTADVLNITTDGKNQTATATFEGITAAGIETVSVDLASSHADNTTVAAGTLTFDDATTVNLSGSKITTATVDAKDGATIDASAVTGTLELTAATADKYTVKGSATKATKFIMSTGLNNGDTIVGGAATTDSLTATINGLTATTGALNISNVEKVQLTLSTAASVVNAAGITGASVIEVGNGTALTGTDLTLTNLAAGTALQLGTTGTLAVKGEIQVSLADATGTNDTLTVKSVDTVSDDDIDFELKGTGIENLVFDVAVDAGTGNDTELTLTNFAASKIVLNGGTTSEVFDISRANSEALNAATVEVDASAFKGSVVAVAATNTATTFKAKAASNFTGSVLGDTVVIGAAGSELGAAIGTINTGSGTDTLTTYVKASADLTGVTNAETINVVLSATAGDYTSDAFTFTAAGGAPGSSPTGIQTATTVNVSGGLAGKTVTLSGDLGDSGARTIDASAALGSIAVTFADAGLVQSNLSDAIVIKGGQGSTDVVNVKAAGNNSNLDTGEFTMSGVEKIVLTSGYTTTNASGDNTVNLKNVTGLTTAAVISGSSTDTASFTNVAAGVGIEIGQGTSAMTSSMTVGLASTSGTTDSLAVKLIKTASGTPTITTDGVETLTLTLNDSTEDHSISLANTNANAATLNVAGANTSADLTINSLATAYNTVSATGLKGKLTLDTGAIGSGVYTITGGDGADTIGMKNTASVLDGGAGSDTLNISFTGTGGALIVDLSSSTDQVQMFNGLANAAVQKGFESVNASAYTQTNSVGADITDSSADNAITGTAYADTIRLSNGGSDTVNFIANSAADTVLGFKSGATASGGDVLNLSALTASAFTHKSGVSGATAITATGPNAGSAVSIGSTLVFIDSNASTSYDTLDELKALVTDAGTTAGEWALADGAVALVAYGDVADGEQSFSIYQVTGGDAASSVADTWTLVGVVTVSDGDALLVANFNIS